jgi:hypothetical protein
MGPPLIALIIAIVIISAVVGAIAQFLNKLNEMNAPPAGRPAGAGRPNGMPARPPSADKDMDRFLAEIDRLRKRNAEGANPSAAPPKPTRQDEDRSRPSVATPVARPTPTSRPADRTPDRGTDRGNDRPKPRVVAELAEPVARPEPTARRGVDRGAMAAPPAPVAPGSLSPDRGRPEDLPVATVVAPTSSTGAPEASRITRFSGRPRPAAKTALGRDLTALLGSPNGVATAIILQEVLGPPKCKKR